MTEISLGILENQPEGLALLGFAAHQLYVDTADIKSMHIIGQPGFGKSTLLGNLAEAFADAGEGVFLIDVKGDLAHNVASRTKHFDRLIYIDLLDAANHDHYWALNPLDFDRDDQRLFEFYANVLPELFARIGPFDPVMMQRINKILSEGVRLALSKRGTTLTDIYLIAHDAAYRRELLQKPNVPPLTYDYWTNVFPQTERDQRGMVESTDSRLRDIMNGPYLSYMLNQETSTLKFKEWLDQGKMVIVNINQKLGALTARKLGNLFIGHLYNEISQRPTGEVAPPWRIIIDEATELATKPFAELITQMRTYSAYPIFAHQNRGQLNNTPELRDAADQASVKVSLQLSDADAELVRRRRVDHDDVDLSDIGSYKAEVSLTKRLPDTPRRQTILLSPWQEEEKPGQLDAALAHQLTLAQHKNQLRTLFDFDRFQRGRGTTEGHHERRKPPDNRREDRQAQENHPTPPAPRPHAGQDVPERDDSGAVRGLAPSEQPPVARQQAAPRPPLSPPPVVPAPGPSEKIGRGHRKGLQPPQPYTPKRPRDDHADADPSQ